MSAAAHASPSRGRVALVLPGGGTRGAYEVGALSVLLPALEARGERVSLACGTSVGAIDAALLGSLAHLPAQSEPALERWRSLRREDVVAPLLGSGLPLQVARLAGDALRLPTCCCSAVCCAGAPTRAATCSRSCSSTRPTSRR
jgi:NTE family protein